MARLSDIIEEFLKELLKDTTRNIIEIKRNELADYFDCSPSQINYVLATRFTIERGFYIESKRGGGGYIKITRLDIDKDDYLLYIISNKIAKSISETVSEHIVDSLLEHEIITEREASIIKSAVNDKSLNLPITYRDEVRADVLKNMFIAILSY